MFARFMPMSVCWLGVLISHYYASIDFFQFDYRDSRANSIKFSVRSALFGWYQSIFSYSETFVKTAAPVIHSMFSAFISLILMKMSTKLHCMLTAFGILNGIFRFWHQIIFFIYTIPTHKNRVIFIRILTEGFFFAFR